MRFCRSHQVWLGTTIRKVTWEILIVLASRGSWWSTHADTLEADGLASGRSVLDYAKPSSRPCDDHADVRRPDLAAAL